MAAHRRLLVSARRHSDRRVLADWKIAERGVGSGPRRRALSRAGLRLHRVPDAVRHSSCRSAEPGPYQTPATVTAPALQRTASQLLRAALRPGHRATKLHQPAWSAATAARKRT